MRTLTQSEKRTIRIAAMCVGTVLAFSSVFQVWKFLSTRRAEYQQLVVESRKLETELKPYKGRVAAIQKLMEGSRLDPAKLSRASVVAEASAAIQKAAAGGVQIGPIRESPARPSARELASMQLDCSGPIQAVMTFLSRFESIGFPLIVDSVQINPEPRPGMVKLHLTIIILDFEQWKGEMPRA